MKRTAAGCGLVLATMLGHAHGAPDTVPGWMAGHWCGGEDGISIEETWLPERGGSLHGVSRMARGDVVLSFEFLRIADDDGVPTYFAQPGGRSATPFRRIDGGADWVRFENPAHDFPQRIEYRREGDGLRAEIAGPGRDGTTRTILFEYQRCPS